MKRYRNPIGTKQDNGGKTKRDTMHMSYYCETEIENFTPRCFLRNWPLFVVSFLLGKSPASVYYCMPTFRNSLSVPSSKAMVEH